MKRSLAFVCLLIALAFLPSCKALGGLLPVIAEIIGDIAKAQDALKTVDGVAQGYFAINPNPELQKEYAKLKGIADNSLGGLLKVAQGAEKASNEDIDAAWDDFREAYTKIISALASAGFRVQFEGEEALQAGGQEGMPLIGIPSPDKMRRTE